MKRIFSGFFLLCALGFSSGCEVVKPYQRAYLNDTEMQPGQKSASRFESKAAGFREGATGEEGSEGGGGCGCN